MITDYVLRIGNDFDYEIIEKKNRLPKWPVISNQECKETSVYFDFHLISTNSCNGQSNLTRLNFFHWNKKTAILWFRSFISHLLMTAWVPLIFPVLFTPSLGDWRRDFLHSLNITHSDQYSFYISKLLSTVSKSGKQIRKKRNFQV